ncbi:hypothetical protein [Cohnella sp.]|uniref:hypothetical protein n=1 Tax=Cohnella sp. TaxID=1883426 RepID=UPI003704C9C5
MSEYMVRQDLINLQSELIEEINKTEKNNEMKINALTNYVERVKYLRGQKSNKKSLVFIGEKGKGKTTTICRLLGLVHNRKKKKANGKEVEVIEDILQTGSGATTISQVVVRGNRGKSYIEIIPFPKDTIEHYLEAFSRHYFFKIHESIDELDPAVELPVEIERACRNITQLKVIRDGDLKIDSVVELVKQYTQSEYQLFIDDIMRRSGLEKRNQTFFHYDEADSKAEVDWLKKTFQEINLVSIPVVPLPKEIIIHLGKEIFDFEDLEFVDQIVDTRGLDSISNNDRKDVYDTFRSNTDNIIFIVDDFKAPNIAIINLLNTHIFDKHSELIDRVMLLVNFRENEPDQLVDCDGVVANEGIGIDVRTNQILMKLHENQIPFKQENILFYNPLRFLDTDKRLSISAEDLEDYGTFEDAKKRKLEIRNIEKLEIINKIKDAVYLQKQIIEEEILRISNNFTKLKKSYENGEYAKIKIGNLLTEIQRKEHGFSLKEKIIFFYKEYLDKKYPITISAINKRYGIFYDNDIFNLGAVGLENEIRYSFKEIKDQIVYFLENLFGFSNISEQQKIMLELVVKEINKAFPLYMKELYEVFYVKFKDNIFSEEDNHFWETCKTRWGKGAGYREDIKNFYSTQIQNSEFYCNCNEILSEHFKRFVDRMIGLLHQLIDTNERLSMANQ